MKIRIESVYSSKLGGIFHFYQRLEQAVELVFAIISDLKVVNQSVNL